MCDIGAQDCAADPLDGVTAIVGGRTHSLGVLADGSAIAWGGNLSGQLGTGDSSSRATPVPVCAVAATDCAAAPLTGIASVAANGSLSLALGTDGTVTGWGTNFRGQLGDGTTTNRSTPVPVCGVGCGGPLTGIVSIDTGGGHGLAVSATGATFAWGFGGYGQLGDHATADRTSPAPVCAVGAADCAAPTDRCGRGGCR